MENINGCLYDISHTYDIELENIIRKLEEIKKIFGNVDDIQEQIKAIADEVKKNIENIEQTMPHEGLYEGYKSIEYSKGLTKINKIEMFLTKYETIIDIDKICDYVNNFLNSSNTTEEQKDKLIDLLLKALKQIKLDDISYDYIKRIIQKLYQTVYQMIKFEIINNNCSKLMEYCKNNSIDSKYLIILIDEDIKKSFKNDSKTMESYIAYLEAIDSSKLDEELIKKIIGKNGLQTKLSDEDLLELEKAFLKNLKAIEELDIKHTVKEEKHKEMCLAKKSIFAKSIPSIVLTSAIICGVFYGNTILIKKFCYQTVYPTTVKVYSNADGEKSDINDNEIMLVDEKTGKEAILTVIEPWKRVNGQYERMYSQYDLSNYDTLSITDYFSYDLEDKDKIFEQPQTTDTLTKGDFYDYDFKEITETTQDLTSPTSEKNDIWVLVTGFLFIIDIMINLLLELTNDLGLRNSVLKLLSMLKKLKTINIKELEQELAGIINKLETMRLENEEIAEKLRQSVSYPEYIELLKRLKKQAYDYGIESRMVIKKPSSSSLILPCDFYMIGTTPIPIDADSNEIKKRLKQI